MVTFINMETYYLLMGIMALLAIVVFVALFFFKAGYGYLGGGKWGPKVNNRTGWIIMECPAFLLMLMYTARYALSGADTGNSSLVLYIMAGLFLVHYFQRSFIFPLLIRGKGTMPVAIIAMGFLFNSMNSYFIGEWLFRFAPAGKYATEWLASPQFIIGSLLFLAGMLINLDSDHVIRNLRKPGDTRHYIPRKGLYKYVTSANYFGELTEWVGFAILTWSPAGLLFAVWTFANLAPRAKALTARYEEEFGDEYKELHKKHLIPFIW